MKLFTFWSFAPFTYIERVCLKSMLAAGHSVDVYTYDEMLKVPEGATVRDAREVSPRDSVIFNKCGNPSLFADLFRYRGLERGLGTWVDMDVILLRNLGDLGRHIFGFASDRVINNAILRLPPDSAFFAYIDRLMQDPVPIPEHWRMRKKVMQRCRAAVGHPQPVEAMKRGVIGPEALTHFLFANGLARLAQPVDVFYPVHWRQVATLFDRNAEIERRLTERTRAVHLWNARLTEYKRHPPPEGSFIARMCERFSV